MTARCICDDGTPVWCDVHGDLWYSDDGDQHIGDPPEDVAAARRAYDESDYDYYPDHVFDPGVVAAPVEDERA